MEIVILLVEFAILFLMLADKDQGVRLEIKRRRDIEDVDYGIKNPLLKNGYEVNHRGQYIPTKPQNNKRNDFIGDIENGKEKEI